VDRKEWVRRHYAESARELDADAFVEGLTEDVRIAGGTSQMVGRDAVHASIEQLRAQGMVSMRHDLEGLWEPEPGVVIAQATVTYTLTTGTTPTLPVVTVFRWREDEVYELRIYMDSTPLAQVAAAAAAAAAAETDGPPS
jgi:SnoaL-like protein